MSLTVPEYIRALTPYVPGKPIEETQREYKLKRVTKLASNENPLGPSPRAVKALKKGISELHRYPDGAAYHLKEALSKHLDVSANELIVGNGSNEVIDMLVRTYCVPGDAIVTSEAAFLAYRICAQIQGAKTLEAPMTADLRSDLSAMAVLVRRNPQAKIVFLPNPNNPTGTYNTATELKNFLKELRSIRDGSVVVALDYAYWEYVTATDLPDPMTFRKQYPNLIILRTFSKIYGLAGLRVGYGIAPPEMIQDLNRLRQPFNLNSLALLAGVEALKDTAFVKRAKRVNDQGRKLWEQALRRMGIPFWPSQGNFILIDTMAGLGRKGSEVYEACLRKGVIFRPVGNYGLANALRISIGTPEENRIAIRALEGELPESAQVSRPARKNSRRSRKG